jgi:hypothetical protein
MLIRRATIGLTLLTFFSLVALDRADDSQKQDQSAQDQQVIKSQAVQRTPASSVNFRKELNLPYGSLSTLGPRIDQAARTGDPVTLAHAANELAVAEKVSGKKANMTSHQVLKQAADLAKLRKQEAELRAVLQVSTQVEEEQAMVASLKQDVKDAQAETQAYQDSMRNNNEPTKAPRLVVVNNYTAQYVDVSVNGYYRTQIPPGSSQTLTIDHPWNPTVLTAYGNDDSMQWGPNYLWGRFHKYTWNIN